PAGAKVDPSRIEGTGGGDRLVIDDGAGRAIDCYASADAFDQPDRRPATAIGDRAAAAGEVNTGEPVALNGTEIDHGRAAAKDTPSGAGDRPKVCDRRAEIDLDARAVVAADGG